MVLVDLENANSDLAQLEQDLNKAVHAGQGADKDESKNAQASTDQNPADNLPDKLKGKSLDEIAEMYANLESAYGRMANDLGQQRKLTDRLLDLKRSDDLEQNGAQPKPEPAKVEFSGSELLDDPQAVLDRYFETKLGQLTQTTSKKVEQVEQSLAERDFVSKHGDISYLSNDQKFAQYVNASPYRQRLAAAAAQNDWVAADELLTDYKALYGEQQDTKTEELHNAKPEESPKDAGNEALKAAQQAQLESGGNGQGANSKQTYSRAALMQMRLTDPDKYYDPAFQDEIMRAYEEKRVK